MGRVLWKAAGAKVGSRAWHCRRAGGRSLGLGIGHHMRHEALHHRRPLVAPDQAGLAAQRCVGQCAVDHARALQAGDGLGHPGHAHAGRHQVDDGLHLDGLLRDLRRGAAGAVGGQQRVVQRRRDLPWKDHQRLGRHIGQVQQRPRGRRMAGRQGHHQRLGQRGPGGKARRHRAGRMQQEAGVDLVGVEGGQLHVQRGLAQLQHHVGVGLAEAAQPLGQRPVGHAGDEGQPKPPGQAGSSGLGHLRQGIRRSQQAAHCRQQRQAGRGERHAAPGAGEQRHAQLPLQSLDGLRQRRLGHVQAGGGAAEVQLVGQRDELAPQPQLDH